MTPKSRIYREAAGASDLGHFTIKEKESDLCISLSGDIDRRIPELARRRLLRIRAELEEYLKLNPDFAGSYVPRRARGDAPDLVKRMAWAAEIAGVGPMAAVAGAIADEIGDFLRAASPCRDVAVENGGDIYLCSRKPRIVAIYAGDSPFSMRIGLKVRTKDGSLGVCTSAGSVGHSLSFGRADAACVVAKNAAVADALATAVGNRIRDQSDIAAALRWIALASEKAPEAGIVGCIAILGEKMGAWGGLEVVPVSPTPSS